MKDLAPNVSAGDADVPGANAEYNSAVSGLFRMVLEPEAVIDFVAALDALAEEDLPDEALASLRAQAALAETLSARIQTRPPNILVEYILLSKAQRILASADASRLFDRIASATAPGQTFALSDAEAQEDLQLVLRSLAPGGQRFLAIHIADDEPPVTLAVARAAEVSNGQLGAAEFMIAAPQSADWTDDLQRAFQDFKLTAAELRVLRALRTDQNAGELAERLGVAESTVRTQIKALLSKIGVSRQAELVRFREEAMRLSSVITEQMKAAMADAARADPPFFPSGRARPPRRLMTLANGRRVSYREFGDADAAPVVVLHGAHSGSMIPEGYKPGADKLGLRLIAPDRPGYGQSTPSRLDLSIEEAAAETHELLDRLRIGDYKIVTLASSAAAGVELARRDPRAKLLAMCSPHFGASPLPGAKPGFGMVLRRRMVQRAPWLMEQGQRVLWGSMSWEGVRTITRALLKRSPADLRHAEEKGLDAYFADVALDALQRPPDGQIWEARALASYSVALNDLATPAMLIYGDEDPVTDKDGMADVFGAPHKARIVTVPGGQLFYYEEWPAVLEAVSS